MKGEAQVIAQFRNNKILKSGRNLLCMTLPGQTVNLFFFSSKTTKHCIAIVVVDGKFSLLNIVTLTIVRAASRHHLPGLLF